MCVTAPTGRFPRHGRSPPAVRSGEIDTSVTDSDPRRSTTSVADTPTASTVSDTVPSSAGARVEPAHRGSFIDALATSSGWLAERVRDLCGRNSLTAVRCRGTPLGGMNECRAVG
ncbi:hypothetical protein GTS_34300 [Gandjariella thermophila]|uniref:Uncharacterized protein n=1 Tax=Gandjariella thermophila TaxID=1931992 RepID=A0A4D4JD30_9PSEU|nr:hypothetical protein GTS_34300 [Gandjariella thermophila]